MQYKHFFFDLDNTVTRSRSLVSPLMKDVLQALMQTSDVIIVSGALVAQSKKQTENLPCFYLGQNGNHAVNGKTNEVIWQRMLSDAEKKEIYAHINSIPRSWSVKDENDLIQDRGSQISYSLLGHNEVLEKKEAFDPDFSKRKQILVEHALQSETVEVKIGGTTCLDYIHKGKHKGYNVAEFIKERAWNKAECIYLGDALFAGGNDDSVVGVIDTHPVKNPEETRAFLQGLLVSG